MQASDIMLARVQSLLASGRKAEAILSVNQLAARGDPDALFTLALWKWRGDLVPPDLAQARDLYRRAGEAGHEKSAAIFTNLLANGIAGKAAWLSALKRLRGEARRDPARRQVLALVDKMKLTPEGRPESLPPAERLSDSPEVTLFRQLFSAAECDHLVQVAQSDFRPSFVVDLQTGEEQRDPVRTSDGSVIHWLIEDPAIHALHLRLAAASGTTVEQGEPLQILRYRPGQEYRNHRDAVPGFDNQRVLTMLVYLNEGYDGGETRFVRTGLEVKGRKGDALLFRNTLADGRADPMSEHAGLPVTRGTKLLASRWIRERPHTPGAAAD
ncbi:MAG TPA: 2OG-Fe(II) oxygenase [Allosphingosinicella sp.]|nr:2OG-Fe(II) oxygenase [Allosphingosinicella sp.]